VLKHQIVVVLAVSIVSACGGRAQPPPDSPVSARTVPDSKAGDNTSDDYVVGPFVTHAGNGDIGDDDAVRTYYIVRN
jgi:hypothetical protein